MRSANCLAVNKPLGSTTAFFACTHLGSIGFSQGLLVGKQKGRMRTPWLVCFTWLLCSRIQVRTSLLQCQEALSQISNQQDLPAACSLLQIQSRNWVVT